MTDGPGGHIQGRSPFRDGFANGGRWALTAADTDRTCDQQISRLCWPSMVFLVNGGAPGRIRTCDTRFRKPMLYPLSYEG